MLSLTRIFLHNWHRFRAQMIEVQDSLYLTGNNGSGKSTILDAIQVVLLADLQHLIRFNSSAQEKSARTLDSFVRGKVFETHWLRPKDTVGYIALEFRDDKTDRAITLGCCIEASAQTAPNGTRAYFILKETLDASLFMPQGNPLPLFELKKTLQKRSKAKYYDVFKEYQVDMREALGGLHPRFFDLFQRALSFKPITRIDDFVKEWLLSEHQIDTKNLQQVSERLNGLHKTAEIVEAKLDLLNRIASEEKSYHRYRKLQGQYEILHVLLRHEEARRASASLLQQREDIQAQISTQAEYLRTIETTLGAAKVAKAEKEKTLYGLDVIRDKDNLQRDIARNVAQADAERERKRRLLQQLNEIGKALGAIGETPYLSKEEQQALGPFLEAVAQLKLEEAFPERLLEEVERAIVTLDTALERVGQQIYAITSQSSTLQEQARIVSEEVKRLRLHGTISYHPNVEALRTALKGVIGSQPDILCERIDVLDTRWQVAVEAMLGNRRFSILVPPETYDSVLQFIERSKMNANIHNARVLDLERAWQQQRRALENSLALQVHTEDAYLRAYINSVLGNIITCASARELRDYDRAITPDLVYYSEWAVQKLSDREYERWFVGKRARDSQIEVREREINQFRTELLNLSTQHTQVKAEREKLDYKDSLKLLRPSLENPPDDTVLRLEIEHLTKLLNALDMSAAQKLDDEIKELDGVIELDTAEQRRIDGEQGKRSEKVEDLDKQYRATLVTEMEIAKEVKETQEKYSEEEEIARKLFAEQCKEQDITQMTNNASRAAKSYTTQSKDALEKTKDLRLEYNIKYQFAGIPEVIHDQRYAQEQERLSATELPRYKEQIRQAQQEADQELREHILHNLRERIQYAREELRRMNDALKSAVFRGDRYQFCWEIASNMQEYYRLIDESQLLGTNPLFESTFYEQNSEIFERFYTELISASQSDKEKKATADLTDYRMYLKYDIEVTHSDGRKSRLSNIVGETSGGETQTPFYLAIAASFVQLYRMLDRKASRHLPPTIRLAVFDEAFNRMDEERIDVTLDLFRQFQLQVITATPLERCEYLVPKMCTNLVVTKVGEEVMIDEYRNYKAKLDAIYGRD